MEGISCQDAVPSIELCEGTFLPSRALVQSWGSCCLDALFLVINPVVTRPAALRLSRSGTELSWANSMAWFARLSAVSLLSIPTCPGIQYMHTEDSSRCSRISSFHICRAILDDCLLVPFATIWSAAIESQRRATLGVSRTSSGDARMATSFALVLLQYLPAGLMISVSPLL